MQYPKGDLNPHSCNSQRILSPSCLPFHHSGSLGAKNGTRTRDPNLGKVVLYQLSYFRNCVCKDRMLFRFCQITGRKIYGAWFYICCDEPFLSGYAGCVRLSVSLPVVSLRFYWGMGSARYSPASGGAIGCDDVALQEIAAFGCRPCHGASGRDVVGGAATGASQAEVCVVELDAYVGVYFYGAAQVVHEGCGVFVGHEHEPAISGGRGYGVGESCGLILIADKATVHETAGYAVLIPHDLAFKFYEDGGGRYAVVVSGIAAGDEEDGESGEYVAQFFHHFNISSMRLISEVSRVSFEVVRRLSFS